MSNLITDEMVETAARATYEAHGLTSWDEEGQAYLDLWRNDARSALEAAAPLIAATALRDAADAADEAYAQEEVSLGAYGNGYIDGVGTALDQIRSRADQIEKENE